MQTNDAATPPRLERQSSIWSLRKSIIRTPTFPTLVDSPAADRWSRDVQEEPRGPIAVSLENPWHADQPQAQPSTVQLNENMKIESSISCMPFQLPVGLDPAVVHLAVALYSFDGSLLNNELPFFHSDCLLIVKTDQSTNERGASTGVSSAIDDGWWEGYLLGSQSRITNFDSYQTCGVNDVAAPEVFKRLPIEHPLRKEGHRMLVNMARDDWQSIRSCSYGFVPAAYLAVIASIDESECQNIINIPQPFSSPGFEDSLMHDDDQGLSSLRNRSLTFTSSQTSLNVRDKIPRRMRQPFHPFVTSGAEEYILKSCETESLEGNGTPDSTTLRYQINTGPAWASHQNSSSLFKNVQIENPSHRRSWSGLFEWTVYHISSRITADEPNGSKRDRQVQVIRRFSHFRLLHEYLMKRYAALLVPDLPDAPFSGRFRERFVRKRMKALQSWVEKICAHPILASCESILLFLAAGGRYETIDESRLIDEGISFEESLKKLKLENGWELGPRFFAHVYHPEFNFAPSRISQMFCEDFVGDQSDILAMQSFVQDLSRKTAFLQDTLDKYYQCSNETLETRNLVGKVLRQLVKKTKDTIRPENASVISQHSGTSTINSWCHRDVKCQQCLDLKESVLSIVKCLQKPSRYSQDSDNILDFLRDWNSGVGPRLSYIMQIHKETIRIGTELERLKSGADHELLSIIASTSSRVSTVLNVIHAEMNHWFHDERIREWQRILSGFVELELARVEEVRDALLSCRRQHVS